LIFEPLNFKRICSQRIFEPEEGGVVCIAFEPTQLVFISSKKGTVKAMTMIRQEKAYVYLDLGHREYCTITVDNNKRKLGMNSDLD